MYKRIKSMCVMFLSITPNGLGIAEGGALNHQS
jgi:hypothetical protein